MSPLARLPSYLAVAVLLLAARSARADEAPPPEPRQAPLADDAPAPYVIPPPVMRAAPPPVPPPPEADEGGDTVLGSHVSHGAYGAPSLKMTTLAGDGAMLVGGEGGWIIGRALVLGGAGYGTVTNVVSPEPLQPAAGNAHLTISYGGVRLGGVVGSNRRTHVTLGVLIGGGGARSETESGTFRRSDSFFVVEPDLAAEVNLARHVRLALGGSYRFVGATEVTGFTPTRLGGPAATLALRFGSF
jgi:hypothetical protein